MVTRTYILAELVAVVVPHIDPLTSGNDQGPLFFVGREIGVGVQRVRDVLLSVGFWSGCHGVFTLGPEQLVCTIACCHQKS